MGVTTPAKPAEPAPLTEDELRELRWKVEKTVKEWAQNKDIAELLQTLPFVMKQSCRRVGYDPPTSIVNSQQLTKAWRRSVLVCHPDKLPMSALTEERLTAKNVFQLVQRKFQIARKNLKKLEKGMSSFASTAWAAPTARETTAKTAAPVDPGAEDGLDLD